MSLQDDDIMGRYKVNYENFMTSMADAAWVKSILSTVAVALSEFFGKDWWLIRLLLILIAVDFVLGIASAIKYNHKLSGQRLHDGVVKVIAYSTAIILTWTVQEIVLHAVPFELPILAFFAGYQSLTEIKSISRHLERLGLPMPSLFTRIFTEVEGKIEEGVESISEVDTSSIVKKAEHVEADNHIG